MSLTRKQTTNVPRARSHRVLLVVARLLVLFSALHVSGVGPVVWGDCCSTDDDDCSGQTDRKPCNGCPPGCPKCQCAPPLFGAPPPVETDCLHLDLLVGRVAWTPYDAVAPRSPPPSCVFRPPKARLFSS